MSTSKVYLIGAGAIARTHAASARTLPAPVQLTVADPVAGARESFAAQFPEARLFASVEEMLSEPAQPDDIVIVATPPFTHCDLTLAALATGRHVLCEKPFAMDREQALKMLEAAKSAGRLVGCCSDRLINVPTTLEAQRLVQEGTLGTIYHATFVHRSQRSRPGIEYQPVSRWFLERAKSGGGILIDWGPYDFSVLNSVFQPRKIEVLHTWMATPHTQNELPEDVVFDVETHIGSTLRYHLPNGNTLIVSYERSSDTHGRSEGIVEIEGSTGAIQWNWFDDKTGTITHSYDEQGQIKRETYTPSPREEPESMSKPLHYFYRRVHQHDGPTIVNEQAVFNFSCLCAIYACAQTGEPQTITWEVEQ